MRHFQELGKVSPSLVIRPAEQPVNGTVSLRGVGTLAFGIGVETAVAITVDGAALPFMARVYTDLPDIAQIEVLRGPQSTLYGKAASAGLVKIMTVQPTDDYHVRGNVTVTGDREYGANVSLTGPISDTLAMSSRPAIPTGTATSATCSTASGPTAAKPSTRAQAALEGVAGRHLHPFGQLC